MIPRTMEQIAQAMGGVLSVGNPSRPAQGVSIDSRTLRPGDLFVAIRGERFDGHDFISAAVETGAAGLVVSREVNPPAGTPIVRVEDTTEALGRLAAADRKLRTMLLVAITGSAGKTTTRALTAAALGARFRTEGTSGNLNNQWGLPLSLLGLPVETEAAVMEMGMNHAGEISLLTRMASPDVGVITNVGTAHLGFFRDQSQLAAAKAELLFDMKPEGTAVIHAGSPFLPQLASRSGRRLITFDLQGPADLVPGGVTGNALDGARFTLEGVEIQLALWGGHAVLNALAALGAARALDIPLAEAGPRLAAIEPLPGRGRILRLERDIVVVDETYNANPSAVTATLEGLQATPWAGRRVAVLGEMKELGTHGAELHRLTGEAAVRSGIHVLVTVGEGGRDLAEGARSAGLSPVLWFEDAAAAAGPVAGLLHDGDLLVIKGSRGVHLEIVLEAVLAAVGGGRRE